jgi:hypothetical protein
MFPLHLVLSPHSTLLEAPAFPAKSPYQPVIAGLPAPVPEQSAARKQRRAAWALTWLGSETAIVPLMGMNVPEMGR